MATDSTFTAEVERLDRQRNSSLAWFLGSFLVWTLGTIAAMFLLIGVLGLGMWVLAPLYVLPLALWLFFLVRYLLIQSRIRSQPRLAEALNDELVRAAWLKAAAAGFWAMLTAEILVTFWRVLANTTVSIGLVPRNYTLLIDIRSPLVLAIGIGVTIAVYLYQRRD